MPRCAFRVVLQKSATSPRHYRRYRLAAQRRRYVVKDPQSAVRHPRNRILRRTHTHCIEETGGSSSSPEDEGDYRTASKRPTSAGLPAADLPAEALRRERSSTGVGRVFEVDDGAADSFLPRTSPHSCAVSRRAVPVYHEVVGSSSRAWTASAGRRRARDMTTGERLSMPIWSSAAGLVGRIARPASSRVLPARDDGRHEPPRGHSAQPLQDALDGDIIVDPHRRRHGTTDEKVTDLKTCASSRGSAVNAQEGKVGSGIRARRCAPAGVRPSTKKASAATRNATRARPCSTTDATASPASSPSPAANGRPSASWRSRP